MAGPSFLLSDLQRVRKDFCPPLPSILQRPDVTFAFQDLPVHAAIKELCPRTSEVKYVELQLMEEQPAHDPSPLRIGVVLSGGQAPGGHNVIMGIFDYAKKHHQNSQIFGFLGGPRGIYTNSYVEVTDELMNSYRNQGGFDMICAGRDKIETPEQYENSLKYCRALHLDGLVVIGGDDSNTNACMLAEYFSQNEVHTKVIGAPKTIDGDLKNEIIEISFGFDSATKTYSEVIGNIAIDSLSSKRYYHFIRVMGRSASHIALECALQTRPTWAFIGEEVKEKRMTLQNIVDELADVIMERGLNGKNYGVILVPEGLIEFIPEVELLISELNEVLAQRQGEEDVVAFVMSRLSAESAELFSLLPESISLQLLLDRDPHGNVQVAKIETERLLILLIEPELTKRGYPHQFFPQSHYFGYEGRSCLPSNFDATYCNAIGHTAAALIRYNFTGCMAVCRGLRRPPQFWQPAGCPLAAMMDIERRKGRNVPVIRKSLVELTSPVFRAYARMRKHWAVNDCFRSPGPIQFEGVGESALNFIISPPSEADLRSSTDDPSSEFPYAPHFIENFSPLAKARLTAEVELPAVFRNGLSSCRIRTGDVLRPLSEETANSVESQYPHLCEARYRRFVELTEGISGHFTPLNIGIVSNGRQASGSHNVIEGVLSALQSRPGSQVLGFMNGTEGLYNRKYFEITKDNFALYRNQGGFDFLGISKDHMRLPEELEKVKESCVSLNLDGLVVLGASHTMTDVAILSDFFLANNVKTRVIGVPASIDGNLGHPFFETSIGFDTASRVNAQMTGNMMTDAASATKYWYFIRLMGRDPSHLVLETSLQTHPNFIVISEVISQEGESIDDIANSIADLVQKRAADHKFYGTVLVPEGLLSHLSHYRELINQINSLYQGKSKEEIAELGRLLAVSDSAVDELMHSYSAPVLKRLPSYLRTQMLTRLDNYGMVSVSLIDTERLLAEEVGKELARRKRAGTYKGSYAPVCHFFGYQGRSSLPSLFDCSLAATYGCTATALIAGGYTGYMTTARGLTGEIAKWKVGAIPLTAMMKTKAHSNFGVNCAVVPSYEVNLSAKAYQTLAVNCKEWEMGDRYTNPGPIQFEGKLSRTLNLTLQYNYKNYLQLLDSISSTCSRIQSICRFGVQEDLLKTAVIGLSSVEGILSLHST
jgi:6-phosphofructokinase 1